MRLSPDTIRWRVSLALLHLLRNLLQRQAQQLRSKQLDRKAQPHQGAA